MATKKERERGGARDKNDKDLEEIEFKCVAVKNNESLLKNQSDVKQVHNETRCYREIRKGQ